MRRIAAITSLVFVAALLAGCTGAGSASRTSGGDAVMPNSQESRDANSQADAAGGGSLIAPDREVITTGSVSLVVDDPTASAEKATSLVVSEGGHIEALNEHPPIDGRGASATLTLRIPADRLDDTLTELKKLGEVRSVTLNRQDVTTEVKDVDARVKALQTSVTRLTELMAKASDINDLVALESALSEREAQLEGLVSQQKFLKDQVALSTLTLSLHQVGTVAPGTPNDFWSGLVAGWQGLVAALAGFVVGLGVALPWLALIAVIAGVTLLIVWLARRRKKQSTRTGAHPEP